MNVPDLEKVTASRQKIVFPDIGEPSEVNIRAKSFPLMLHK